MATKVRDDNHRNVKPYHGGDKVFLRACELAKTPATQRQWTKYATQQRGAAYAKKAEAERAPKKS